MAAGSWIRRLVIWNNLAVDVHVPIPRRTIRIDASGAQCTGQVNILRIFLVDGDGDVIEALSTGKAVGCSQDGREGLTTIGRFTQKTLVQLAFIKLIRCRENGQLAINVGRSEFDIGK